MFKDLFKNREERKQQKRLSEISATFGTLRELEESGLIYWDAKQRRLIIADSLATVMLAHGAKGWVNFLNNVFLYVTDKLIAERWADRLAVKTAKATAKARQLTPELTAAQLRRIKDEVAESLSKDEVNLPKPEPFEFYIVSNDAQAAPLQCGVYDPVTDRFDIADWSEIAAPRAPSGS